MAGCKTIRMEKQIEVRLQKAFSQGRERLRVELFKDWPVQSTMRVGMATKVEYARDGREKKEKRGGKSKKARACLRLADATQTFTGIPGARSQRGLT